MQRVRDIRTFNSKGSVSIKCVSLHGSGNWDGKEAERIKELKRMKDTTEIMFFKLNHRADTHANSQRSRRYAQGLQEAASGES